MSDKLPDGVVLAMEQIVVGDSNPCDNCYFCKADEPCPTDLNENAGLIKWSCTNDRDIIFIEIGESDDR